MPSEKHTPILAWGALITIIALMSGSLVLSWSNLSTSLLSQGENLSPQLARVEQQLADLKAQVETLRGELEAVTKSDADLVASKLRVDLDRIEKRLAAIERMAMDNPERVLDLTILRKEIEALRTTYAAELQATRNEVGNIYDLMKWFVGLFMTLILAGIGYVASNKRRGEKADRPTASNIATAPRTGRIIDMTAHRALRDSKSTVRRPSRSR